MRWDSLRTPRLARRSVGWRWDDLIIDVMPVDERVLGSSNRWYPAAIETAQTVDIVGHDVRLVTPALFIATKLEAFHGRGRGPGTVRRTRSR